VGFLAAEALQEGLEYIRQSPSTLGTLQMIVCRPAENERQVLDEARLDQTSGLVGDTWSVRVSSRTADGSPDPEAQITLMNARAIALIAGSTERWPLAGDQLYVDFDLSQAGVPPGTRLAIGDAVIEITAKPHRGCAKFGLRFGTDALRFVNTGPGILLNLRGRNARVISPGTIRRGHAVQQIAQPHRAASVNAVLIP
jgi:MOSC domain-containing protein YiiM